MKPNGILVIGGTGFVGRSLISALCRKYTEIYIVARHDSDWSGFPNVQSFESSLDNAELLNNILPRCGTVFHLASETTPGVSALQPSFEAASNLLPSLRFLECLQKYPHILLVYISSGGAVYGDTLHDLVSEDVALSPLSYYGAGKAALEKFILAFCKQTKGQAIILRPSNFYGPGQPYRPGFGVIPTIFHYMVSTTAMPIWGDGEMVRDYLYIDDFIELCMVILDRRLTQKENIIYNIGSAEGTTLNELCVLAEKVSGRKLIREYQSARTVDVKKIILDCSHLQQDYNWFASTSLNDGLARTWKWFCQLAEKA